MAKPEERGLFSYFLNAKGITNNNTLVAIAYGASANLIDKMSKEDAVGKAV